MVEPVGAGEEDSRLADVKLELIVPEFVAAGKRIISIFCQSWGCEKRRVHVSWA